MSERRTMKDVSHARENTEFHRVWHRGGERVPASEADEEEDEE